MYRTYETYREVITDLQLIIDGLKDEIHKKNVEAMRREGDLRSEITMLKFRLSEAEKDRDYWREVASKRLDYIA